jgi:hypothetical protein
MMICWCQACGLEPTSDAYKATASPSKLARQISLSWSLWFRNPCEEYFSAMRRSPKVLTTKSQVKCTCEVELASRFLRPYHFRVIVRGEPPFAVTRVYDISAWTDKDAALKGMEIFGEQMTKPQHLIVAPH